MSQPPSKFVVVCFSLDSAVPPLSTYVHVRCTPPYTEASKSSKFLNHAFLYNVDIGNNDYINLHCGIDSGSATAGGHSTPFKCLWSEIVDSLLPTSGE